MDDDAPAPGNAGLLRSLDLFLEEFPQFAALVTPEVRARAARFAVARLTPEQHRVYDAYHAWWQARERDHEFMREAAAPFAVAIEEDLESGALFDAFADVNRDADG